MKNSYRYEDEFAENIFLDLMLSKEIAVFLIGGVRLTGELLDYDPKVILVKKNDSKQIIYKSSIASISLLCKNNRG